jgi:hypothetical protein
MRLMPFALAAYWRSGVVRANCTGLGFVAADCASANDRGRTKFDSVTNTLYRRIT